jgi:hypothetical protein
MIRSGAMICVLCLPSEKRCAYFFIVRGRGFEARGDRLRWRDELCGALICNFALQFGERIQRVSCLGCRFWIWALALFRALPLTLAWARDAIHPCSTEHSRMPCAASALCSLGYASQEQFVVLSLPYIVHNSLGEGWLANSCGYGFAKDVGTAGAASVAAPAGGSPCTIEAASGGSGLSALARSKVTCQICASES